MLPVENLRRRATLHIIDHGTQSSVPAMKTTSGHLAGPEVKQHNGPFRLSHPASVHERLRGWFAEVLAESVCVVVRVCIYV